MTARVLDLAAFRHPVRTWASAFTWPRGTVTIPPPVDAHGLMPELGHRVALLNGCGNVHVSVDLNFIPAQCEWCKLDRPRVTSVRVWGDPGRARPRSTLRMACVCLQCALGIPRPAGATGTRLGAVGQALAEARPGAVVLVEVCE